MIRIVMLGRLGNNLFQYALGRVLAERHGVPLVMDGSWFNREGWEQVRCIKALPGPASGKARIIRRCSLGARALLKLTGRHYWEFRGVPVFRESETDQRFDPRFLGAPPDCMLFGYFQTPLYFRGFEDVLRGELSTTGLGLEKNRESIANNLRKPGAIAVHVRRGDYVGNPQLDVCTPQYYTTAMDRMRASVANPLFHVFSDDPLWCDENLSGEDITVVPYDPHASPLVDLHLMSLAEHHIIANSSYSWWAAWLGKKPRQKVLMPPRWFGMVNAPVDEKRCPGWELA